MWLPPRAVAALPPRRKRNSPRARDYDAKWDRLSIAFRKANPFCRFCAQFGRDALCDVTDHIIPAADRSDLRYEWKNLQALCAYHHDGLKQRMEKFARALGRLEELPRWCADLKSGPVEFRTG